MTPRPILRTVGAVASLVIVTLGTNACRGPSSVPSPAATPDTAAMMRDVRYLASDALEGRGTGTAGNDSAAAYIARRFAGLGLSPAFAAGETRVCASARSCDARFIQ